MNTRRIEDLIQQAYRRRGLTMPSLRDTEPSRRREAEALAEACRLIESEAMTEQRNAARLASQVGASITRGRTRL